MLDPRFFPFYPGRKRHRSLSLERLEKELRGETFQLPEGSGLAELSRYRRAVRLTDELKSRLREYLPPEGEKFLEKASFAVVQGKLKILEGPEGILVGYAPVVALTDAEGVPYCTVPISLRELYSLLGEKVERTQAPVVERESFRERLKEGLEGSLELEFLPEEGRKNAERALFLLERGEPLEKVLVEGLTFKPHQARESVRIASLLEEEESVLLGWEMRGGKTLTGAAALFLAGKKGGLVFKSANIPDVLGQFSLRAPFMLGSLAVLKVSGLKVPFPLKEYSTAGKVVPNFQSFVAKREKEYGVAGSRIEYDMASYLKKDREEVLRLVPETGREVFERLVERAAEKGYDRELTEKALVWLIRNVQIEKAEKIVEELSGVEVYEWKERYLIIPASRVATFTLSEANKNSPFLSVPPAFEGLLVDEADALAGVKSQSFAGLSELSKKSGAKVFMTGTFSSGYPESSVALSCLLAGKSKTFTEEAVKEAEKELGVFSISGTPKGKAVSFALRLYRDGITEFSPESLTEEQKIAYREVLEAYTFSVEKKNETPEKVIKDTLKYLEEGYSPFEVCTMMKVGTKRESGTFNPIALAHSVAPVYLSLASRRQLSAREERLEFDLENAEKTLELKGAKADEELFAPGSFSLRRAVDTAVDRYRAHSYYLSEVVPDVLRELEKAEERDVRLRRSSSTAGDGARTLFLRWLFRGIEPEDEYKREYLRPIVERIQRGLPSPCWEKLTFVRPGWPFKVTLTYSPFLGATQFYVDSFSNRGLYERVVKGTEKEESLFITGSFVAANAFLMIDAMVSAKGDEVFVWRATKSSFDKLLQKAARKLSKEFLIVDKTPVFAEKLKELREKGRTVIAASTDEAVARGVDLSFMDAMVVSYPSFNSATAVQLYSRLFSVDRHEAEVTLFGTYLQVYQGRVYPGKGFYFARRTYEAQEFSRAVVEGRLPLEEGREPFVLSPQSEAVAVEGLLDGIEF